MEFIDIRNSYINLRFTGLTEEERDKLQALSPEQITRDMIIDLDFIQYLMDNEKDLPEPEELLGTTDKAPSKKKRRKQNKKNKNQSSGEFQTVDGVDSPRGNNNPPKLEKIT